EIGRTLRYLWELVLRAFYADEYATVCPGDGDGPGETPDEKLDWLEAQERGVWWSTVLLPGIRLLLGWTREESSHFGEVWDRLNRVVHPSVRHLRSGFAESRRHAFNHFDEGLARQVLSDASEVFAVIWCVFLHRFPAIRQPVARNPRLFD